MAVLQCAADSWRHSTVAVHCRAWCSAHGTQRGMVPVRGVAWFMVYGNHSPCCALIVGHGSRVLTMPVVHAWVSSVHITHARRCHVHVHTSVISPTPASVRHSVELSMIFDTIVRSFFSKVTLSS